jgi:hypothetical protein
MSQLLDKLNHKTLDIHDFDMKNNLTNTIINQMVSQNLIHQDPQVFIINQYIVQQFSPYTDKINLNNTTYILPNLLAYLTISLLLHSVSLHFIPVISSMILKSNTQKMFYTIINRFQPLSFNNIFTNNKQNSNYFKYLLFQAAHALLTGQQVYKLTHYQCYHNNILYTDWPKDKQFISYPLPNRNKRLMINQQDCPFLIMIKDYSLARINTNQFTLIPENSLDNEFNSWYDFATLLGSIIVDNKFKKILKIKDNYKFILNLILWFFYDSLNITNYTKKQFINVKKYICYRYYGTNDDYFYEHPLFGNKTKTMIDVVNHLGDMLNINTNNVINNNVIIIPDLSPYDLNDVNAETDNSLSIIPSKKIILAGYNTCQDKQTYSFKTLKEFGPGCKQALSQPLIKFIQQCTKYFGRLIPFDQYVVWRYTIGSATINHYLIFKELGENAQYWCYLFILYFKNTFNHASVPLAFQKYKHYFDDPQLFLNRVSTKGIEDIINLYINRLQTIIQNAPKPKENITVYKVSCYYPELPQPQDLFVPKQIIQLPFNSTTINPNLNFATFIKSDQLRDAGPGCCFFQIKIPAGVSCLYIPKEFHAYPFENEILLPHQTTFNIKSINVNTFHFIDVDTMNIVDVQEDKDNVIMGPVFEVDMYNPCHGQCVIEDKPFYVYQTVLS